MATYALPEDFLVSDQGETKSVFRAAMRGQVPDAILDRRDKIGFATPEDVWMKETSVWLDGVLASDMMHSIGAFDARGMAREVEAVKSGRKRLSGDVWRWVNLARWAECFDVTFD